MLSILTVLLRDLNNRCNCEAASAKLVLRNESLQSSLNSHVSVHSFAALYDRICV